MGCRSRLSRPCPRARSRRPTGVAAGFYLLVGPAQAFVRDGYEFSQHPLSLLMLGDYGLGMIASGIFPPDPMAGFPAGATTAEGTVSGMLHLAFGAIGFLCLAASAFVAARWLGQLGEPRLARFSRVGGGIVALGFIVRRACGRPRAGRRRSGSPRPGSPGGGRTGLRRRAPAAGPAACRLGG